MLAIHGSVAIGQCLGVEIGAVSAASIQIVAAAVLSAPNDHLPARPDRAVKVAGSGQGGGSPSVATGTVSPACVQSGAITSAEHDHFRASPHRCVMQSADGCIGDARGYPTIGARYVSATSV